MSRRIVVLDGYTLTPLQPGEPGDGHEPTWAGLEELGELTVYPRLSGKPVVEAIGEAEIVLTNKAPIDAATIQQAPNLKYIGVLATGVNVVDCAAAREAGIPVTNIPGYSSNSVAQHVFALLLELVMQPAAHDRAVHDGQWSGGEDFSFRVAPLTELAGKTLGIVGLGQIGQRVAQIGAAMGMSIAAGHQRSMNDISLPGIDIDWQPIDALLPKVDALTLHCPLTDKTRHLIDRAALEKMKPGSWLINTGRGPLLDEAAVAEALQTGRLGGAGLDVLSSEPPSPDNPLFSAPNCVITPHIAWGTVEARNRAMAIAVDNVRAFLQSESKNVVNT
jgi:glycerate dehydrogenase